MPSQWLTALAWAALGSAFASAGWLGIEQIRHPQRMGIMALVWPITALYMGPIAIWAYYQMGIQNAQDRSSEEKRQQREKRSEHIQDPVRKKEARAGKPFWKIVYVGVTHCGSGCTLGDIWGEFMLFFAGFTFAGTLFKSELVMDYILAYLLGILFQYYSIAPMRGISGLKGIWAAMKADTLSLTAFEIGLFGWMAIYHFFIFPGLKEDMATYWFMMQIGMCLGFFTAYPVNWWLIKHGLKEAM